MTSLAPLVFLLAFGFLANVGLIAFCLRDSRAAALRERRDRSVVRELNTRRWIFADRIAARGGGSRVPSSERWPA